MKNLPIKLSLYLNYFVFAILLNSVGIVILKSQLNYGVDEVSASTLELFKDMPIAIVSFLVASFLPRIGYKKSMLVALAIVALACVAMYFGNSFVSAKLLFAAVGVAFALIKVSVYSIIGLLTDNSKAHNSFMSSIEGFFMLGIALAYFLFPYFNDTTDPQAWLRVHILLAVLSLLSFVFLLFTTLDESEIKPTANDLTEDIKAMTTLMGKSLVLVFVVSAFLFVMVEQGIMTWLPTFNNKILKLSENVGIMMASILAISLAVGRIVAGWVTQHVSWFYVLVVCIVAAMLGVVFLLPKTVNVQVGAINSITDIPLIGFAFPMVGLFIAPIYPLSDFECIAQKYS